MAKFAACIERPKVESASASGGEIPWPPDQGLCPWTPNGALPPDLRYGLALPPRTALAMGPCPPDFRLEPPLSIITKKYLSNPYRVS